jgi:hypothetical protein
MTDTKQWIGAIKSEPAPELWEEAGRRASHGARARIPGQSRPWLAAALMLVALVVVGSLLFALRPLNSLRRSGAPAPGEITRYSMEGAPQPLAVGDGAAWVDVTHMSQDGTGPSMIWRIDAATGEIRQLPQTLGAVWVTAGAEGVWATCDTASCGGHGVLQLDPSTGDVLRTVSLPDHTSQIALGLGDVWVTTEGGLVKIDAGSGQIVDRYPGRYNLLGVSEHAVWVTTPGGVTQIDASTGGTLNHFPFPDPCNLAVTPTVIFVATCGGATIKREALEAIDARTDRVLYRVTRDYSFGPMRLSGNTLIIAEHDPTAQGYIRLVQLDAATGKPAGSPFEIKSDETRFTIHSFIEPGPFFGVGEGSAWVSDFGAGEVLRVGLPLSGSATPIPLPTQQSPASPRPHSS